MLNRRSSTTVPREVHHKLDEYFENLKAVGISYIGHGVISDTGNHSGYFSNEKWGRFYIENKYFFSEPILEKYEEGNLGLITWGSLKDANTVARIRHEHTKLTSGMTICKKEKGFDTFFNLGFDKDIDLIEFSFFKRDLLLAYFNIFNNYHLQWRKWEGY